MKEHFLLSQPRAEHAIAWGARTRSSAQPAIGGMVSFSSLDWPGKLCAVVFLSGCPWRCGYCHNPHLHQRDSVISMEALERFLSARKGLLDGLVISGGEPLMDPACPDLAHLAKNNGFKVALHTAGIYPDRLESMLNSLDWVGLDIKTTANRYDALTNRARSFFPVMKSLDVLIQWGGDFECRTTWDPSWLPQTELLELAEMLCSRGVKSFAVQRYREEGVVSTQAELSASSRSTLKSMFAHFDYR